MITAWCALNAAIRVQPFVLGGITVVELPSRTLVAIFAAAVIFTATI
jgi:hypothetical protein